jgi:hypothetical protein
VGELVRLQSTVEPPPCFHNVISPAASPVKIAEVAKGVVTAASLVCDFFVTGWAPRRMFLFDVQGEA